MPTTATSEPERIISGCRLVEDLGRGTGRLKVPTTASTALEDAWRDDPAPTPAAGVA